MMAAGCLASVLLWLIMLMLVMPDGATTLALAGILATMIVIVRRWLHSDWPLY